MQLTLDELLWALPHAWGADTGCGYNGSKYAVRHDKHPAAGQSITSSLLIKQHLGGQLLRCGIGQAGYRTEHYFNQLENGMWVDSTRSQFSSRSPMGDIKRNPDPKLWNHGDTFEKVAILERRVFECLYSTYVAPAPLWMRDEESS